MPLLTPHVPNGLIELMKDLAKEVLRDKPDNIYEFAAVHLEKLIQQRDGSLNKGYEEFVAFEAHFDGQQRFAVPANSGYKCQRPIRIQPMPQPRKSKSEIMASFQAMESINEEDVLSGENPYADEKYQKAIYVIQRYFRRYLAKKKNLPSSTPLSAFTAAVIIQRTMRRLFSNNIKLKTTEKDSNATVVVVSAVKLIQDDVDNVSEAASYTSSSTIQMLADGQEGRENRLPSGEGQRLQHDEVLEDGGADLGSMEFKEQSQDEPPLAPLPPSPSPSPSPSSPPPPQAVVDDEKHSHSHSHSDVVEAATEMDRKSITDENGNIEPTPKEAPNKTIAPSTDDTSTAHIGILSTKIGSNDHQNSPYTNNTVEIDRNRSEPTTHTNTKPYVVAALASATEAVVAKSIPLNYPQSLGATPDTLPATSPNLERTQETFAVHLQDNGYGKNNDASVLHGNGRIRKFDPDTGESLKIYEVFYQDINDPEFSDSLNESTMEKDSLEPEELDVDSLESNENVAHVSGLVKREVKLDDGSLYGDADNDVIDESLEKNGQKFVELERVPTYLYGIHPARTPVPERMNKIRTLEESDRKSLETKQSEGRAGAEMESRTPEEKSEEESLESKGSTSEESSATQIENNSALRGRGTSGSAIHCREPLVENSALDSNQSTSEVSRIEEIKSDSEGKICNQNQPKSSESDEKKLAVNPKRDDLNSEDNLPEVGKASEVKSKEKAFTDSNGQVSHENSGTDSTKAASAKLINSERKTSVSGPPPTAIDSTSHTKTAEDTTIKPDIESNQVHGSVTGMGHKVRESSTENELRSGEKDHLVLKVPNANLNEELANTCSQTSSSESKELENLVTNNKSVEKGEDVLNDSVAHDSSLDKETLEPEGSATSTLELNEPEESLKKFDEDVAPKYEKEIESESTSGELRIAATVHEADIPTHHRRKRSLGIAPEFHNEEGESSLNEFANSQQLEKLGTEEKNASKNSKASSTSDKTVQNSDTSLDQKVVVPDKKLSSAEEANQVEIEGSVVVNEISDAMNVSQSNSSNSGSTNLQSDRQSQNSIPIKSTTGETICSSATSQLGAHDDEIELQLKLLQSLNDGVNDLEKLNDGTELHLKDLRPQDEPSGMKSEPRKYGDDLLKEVKSGTNDNLEKITSLDEGIKAIEEPFMDTKDSTELVSLESVPDSSTKEEEVPSGDLLSSSKVNSVNSAGVLRSESSTEAVADVAKPTTKITEEVVEGRSRLSSVALGASANLLSTISPMEKNEDEASTDDSKKSKNFRANVSDQDEIEQTIHEEEAKLNLSASDDLEVEEGDKHEVIKLEKSIKIEEMTGLAPEDSSGGTKDSPTDRNSASKTKDKIETLKEGPIEREEMVGQASKDSKGLLTKENSPSHIDKIETVEETLIGGEEIISLALNGSSGAFEKGPTEENSTSHKDKIETLEEGPIKREEISSLASKISSVGIEEDPVDENSASHQNNIETGREGLIRGEEISNLASNDSSGGIVEEGPIEREEIVGQASKDSSGGTTGVPTKGSSPSHMDKIKTAEEGPTGGDEISNLASKESSGGILEEGPIERGEMASQASKCSPGGTKGVPTKGNSATHMDKIETVKGEPIGGEEISCLASEDSFGGTEQNSANHKDKIKTVEERPIKGEEISSIASKNSSIGIEKDPAEENSASHKDKIQMEEEEISNLASKHSSGGIVEEGPIERKEMAGQASKDSFGGSTAVLTKENSASHKDTTEKVEQGPIGGEEIFRSASKHSSGVTEKPQMEKTSTNCTEAVPKEENSANQKDEIETGDSRGNIENNQILNEETNDIRDPHRKATMSGNGKSRDELLGKSVISKPNLSRSENDSMENTSDGQDGLSQIIEKPMSEGEFEERSKAEKERSIKLKPPILNNEEIEKTFSDDDGISKQLLESTNLENINTVEVKAAAQESVTGAEETDSHDQQLPEAENEEEGQVETNISGHKEVNLEGEIKKTSSHDIQKSIDRKDLTIPSKLECEQNVSHEDRSIENHVGTTKLGKEIFKEGEEKVNQSEEGSQNKGTAPNDEFIDLTTTHSPSAEQSSPDKNPQNTTDEKSVLQENSERKTGLASEDLSQTAKISLDPTENQNLNGAGIALPSNEVQALTAKFEPKSVFQLAGDISHEMKTDTHVIEATTTKVQDTKETLKGDHEDMAREHTTDGVCDSEVITKVSEESEENLSDAIKAIEGVLPRSPDQDATAEIRPDSEEEQPLEEIIKKENNLDENLSLNQNQTKDNKFAQEGPEQLAESASTEMMSHEDSSAETTAGISSIGKDLDFFEDTIKYLRDATEQLGTINGGVDEKNDPNSTSKLAEGLSQSAVVIQSAFREYQARKHLKTPRHENKDIEEKFNAVDPINSATHMEAYDAELQPERETQENCASNSDNKSNSELNSNSAQVLTKAATTIQSSYRGHRVRRALKEEKVTDFVEKSRKPEIGKDVSFPTKHSFEINPEKTQIPVAVIHPTKYPSQSASGITSTSSGTRVKDTDNRTKTVGSTQIKKRASSVNESKTKGATTSSTRAIKSDQNSPTKVILKNNSQRSVSLSRQKPLEKSYRTVKNDSLERSNIASSSKTSSINDSLDKTVKNDQIFVQKLATIPSSGYNRKSIKSKTSSTADLIERPRGSVREQFDRKGKSMSMSGKDKQQTSFDLEVIRRELLSKKVKTPPQSGGKKKVGRNGSRIPKKFSSKTSDQNKDSNKVEQLSEDPETGITGGTDIEEQLKLEHVDPENITLSEDPLKLDQITTKQAKEEQKPLSKTYTIRSSLNEMADSNQQSDMIDNGSVESEVLQNEVPREIPSDLVNPLEKSATTIQKTYRGYRVRRSLKGTGLHGTTKIETKNPDNSSNGLVFTKQKEVKTPPENQTSQPAKVHEEVPAITEEKDLGTASVPANDAYLSLLPEAHDETKAIDGIRNSNSQSDNSKALELEKSATTIQKTYRGYRSRKRLESESVGRVTQAKETKLFQPATIQTMVDNQLISLDTHKDSAPHRDGEVPSGDIFESLRKDFENYKATALDKSATTIQKHFRGYKARKGFKSNSTKHSSEPVRDAEVPSGDIFESLRKDFENYKVTALDKSATTIQKHYRGYKARKGFISNGTNHNSEQDTRGSTGQLDEEAKKGTEEVGTGVQKPGDFIVPTPDKLISSTTKDDENGILLDNSATTIQKNYRGYKTRKLLKKEEQNDNIPQKQHKTIAEVSENTIGDEKSFDKKSNKTLVLADSYKSKVNTNDEEASLKQQTGVFDSFNVEEFHSAALQKSATTIQKTYRGYKTRKELLTQKESSKTTKEFPENVLDQAATTIQSSYRGYRSRKAPSNVIEDSSKKSTDVEKSQEMDQFPSNLTFSNTELENINTKSEDSKDNRISLKNTTKSASADAVLENAASTIQKAYRHYHTTNSSTGQPIKSYSHGTQREATPKEGVENSDESSTFIGPDTSFDLSDVDSVETRSDKNMNGDKLSSSETPTPVNGDEGGPESIITIQIHSEDKEVENDSGNTPQKLRRKRSIMDPTAPPLEDILLSADSASTEQKPKWFVGDDLIIPSESSFVKPSLIPNPLVSPPSRIDELSSIDACPEHSNSSNQQLTPSIKSAVVSTSSLLLDNITEMHGKNNLNKNSGIVSAIEEENLNLAKEETGSQEIDEMNGGNSKDNGVAPKDRKTSEVKSAKDPVEKLSVDSKELGGEKSDDMKESTVTELCKNCADGIHEGGICTNEFIKETSQEMSISDLQTHPDAPDKNVDKIKEFVLMEESDPSKSTSVTQDPESISKSNVDDKTQTLLSTNECPSIALIPPSSEEETSGGESNHEKTQKMVEDKKEKSQEPELNKNPIVKRENQHEAVGGNIEETETSNSKEDCEDESSTNAEKSKNVDETIKNVQEAKQDFNSSKINEDAHLTESKKGSEDHLDTELASVTELKKIVEDPFKTQPGEELNVKEACFEDDFSDSENILNDLNTNGKNELPIDLMAENELPSYNEAIKNAEEASKHAKEFKKEVQKDAGEIKKDTEEVKKDAEEVQKHAEDILKDTGIVQKDAEEVQKHAEEDHKHAEDIPKDAEEFQKDVGKVQKDSEEVQKDTEEVQNDADEVQKHAEKVQKHDEDIPKDNKEVQKDVAELQKHADDIPKDTKEVQKDAEKVQKVAEDVQREAEVKSNIYESSIGEFQEEAKSLKPEDISLENANLKTSDEKSGLEPETVTKDSKTNEIKPEISEIGSTLRANELQKSNATSEKENAIGNPSLSVEGKKDSKDIDPENPKKQQINEKLNSNSENKEAHLSIEEKSKPVSEKDGSFVEERKKEESLDHNQPQNKEDDKPSQEDLEIASKLIASSLSVEKLINSEIDNRSQTDPITNSQPKSEVEAENASTLTSKEQPSISDANVQAHVDELIEDNLKPTEDEPNAVDPEDLPTENASQEVIETPCVKVKVLPLTPMSVSSDPDESELDSTTTKAYSTTTTPGYDDASENDILDIPPSKPDVLDAMTEKLLETEAMVARMRQRRASEHKISMDSTTDQPVAFEEPICEPIKPMQRLQKSSSTEVEDDYVLQKLQRGDTTRESSAQSEHVVFGASIPQQTESDDTFNENLDRQGLQRMNTIATNRSTFKPPSHLSKSVTIDDTVKYIDPEKSTEESGGSFSMDDAMSEDVRKKMMAYSVSEADSDYYDFGDQNSHPHDDFNISTALDNFPSTDTDTTIISAATKIQAGARGFLTRRRIRRASMGTKTSLNEERKTSFGNDAIGESLDQLAEEENNKRQYNRQTGVNSLPSAMSHSDETNQSTKSLGEGGLHASMTPSTKHSSIDNEYEQPSTPYEYDVNAEISDPSEDDSPRAASYLESTLARRLTLQRGDAMRNDSTPDDENGNGKQVDLAKNISSTIGSMLIHEKTTVESTTTTTTRTTTDRRNYSDAAVKTKKNKIKWFALRQNSMPVQIDSEVFRVLPKHMRKRIKSAEGEKTKRIRLPRD